MNGGRVQVKKVKAYPFAAAVKLGTGTLPAQVVKVTVQGFLIEFNLKTIKPGDKFDIWFELPVLKHSVSEPCVVVKLYNQWSLGGGPAADVPPPPAGEPKAAAQTPSVGPTPAKVAQLVECHFVHLSPPNRERIQQFLNAIGRRG